MPGLTLGGPLQPNQGVRVPGLTRGPLPPEQGVHVPGLTRGPLPQPGHPSHRSGWPRTSGGRRAKVTVSAGLVPARAGLGGWGEKLPQPTAHPGPAATAWASKPRSGRSCASGGWRAKEGPRLWCRQGWCPRGQGWGGRGREAAPAPSWFWWPAVFGALWLLETSPSPLPSSSHDALLCPRSLAQIPSSTGTPVRWFWGPLE